MKILKSLAVKSLSMILLVISFTAINSNAQSYSIEEITKNEYALDNLIVAIKSENCGLKRSAVYFAGKYRIKEVQEVLLDELKNESEACTKILIALVLYELGNSDGLLSIRGKQGIDEDKNVGRMATQIYYNYLMNDTR
jgi:hypothetical protein